MATSTRRRKPAPAVPVPDPLTQATAAEAPAAGTAAAETAAPAAPADAAPDAPAKKARAPRKTTPARKRATPAATDSNTSVDAAPDAGADASAPHPADAPAVPGAEPPVTAPAPAARSPRPRRKRGEAASADGEVAVAAPPIDEPPAGEGVALTPETAADLVPPVEAANVADLPADPPAVEPPPAPPLPPHSHLGLEDDGLQRRLRWQSGARCPDTLAQALRRWQPARGGDGHLALTQVDDLAELLAIAARTGHEVQVEPAAWQHLARLGDLQGRIAHLESRHPQGLDPAAQPEGSLLAGWRACQLEAAFFAACVGRCVLADEPALQPEAELLLAARLVMLHFGTAAPVVQAPPETHAGWQVAWAQVGGDSANESEALTLLPPEQPATAGTELLLLDQRAGLQPVQAESPAAQQAPWLWVLAPADLIERPEAAGLLAVVDQLRQGDLAAWHHSGDAEALAPLLLARRFADVAGQWPAWQAIERTTPAPAGEAAAQAELGRRLARWQRSGFLADSDQLALRQLLQAAWASARAANAAALPGLLREALAADAGRIVVFSEDAGLLPPLAQALQAEGLPADALPTIGAPRQADQALRPFCEATEPRILLAADGPGGDGPRILLAADGPGGDGPRIGVQLAPPLVIHLDTPWAAGTLARRLQRVRPGPAQREVPVWQLLPEGSLMARRAKALPAAATEPPSRLGGTLLRGPALDGWQAELAALGC